MPGHLSASFSLTRVRSVCREPGQKGTILQMKRDLMIISHRLWFLLVEKYQEKTGLLALCHNTSGVNERCLVSDIFSFLLNPSTSIPQLKSSYSFEGTPLCILILKSYDKRLLEIGPGPVPNFARKKHLRAVPVNAIPIVTPRCKLPSVKAACRYRRMSWSHEVGASVAFPPNLGSGIR